MVAIVEKFSPYYEYIQFQVVDIRPEVPIIVPAHMKRVTVRVEMEKPN